MWGAVAANLRVTFPDVVLGFYTPDEMGAEVTITDTDEMVIKPETQAAPETPRAALAEPAEMVNDAQEPIEAEVSPHFQPEPAAPANRRPLEEILADPSIIPNKSGWMQTEGCITEKQGKRFFALCKKGGKTKTEIEQFLAALKIAHTWEMKWQVYDKACKWAEATN
jgi:hypothetical protein